MHFDADNAVYKLCAEGMMHEGNREVASALFNRAWQMAQSNMERAVAAHYVARHQPDTLSKLHWDEKALQFAKEIPGNDAINILPSLHLNIGKCHEDLGDKALAIEHYRLAKKHLIGLPQDGYTNMISRGIDAGLNRLHNIF